MRDLRPDEERDLLAAELALGLLDGAERAEAERLLGTDPHFSFAFHAWQERLAPLADEAGEASPGANVWDRIEAELGAEAAPASNFVASNVVQLRRKLGVWRGYGAGMTALAASLALLLGYQVTSQQAPTIVQPQPQAPAPRVLVAALASEEADSSLSIAYNPAARDLLVTPARLEPAAGHDHELWIIPPGGTPVSLGLVRTGASQRVPVRPEYEPHFRARSTLAVSVEPTGGSRTGQPTGPVIAAGELLPV